MRYTDLTPSEQPCAASDLHSLIPGGPNWESEGANWHALDPILEEMAW